MENLKSDSDSSLSVLKRQERLRLKQIRQGLDPKRREDASSKACRELMRLTKSAPLVLSFASFGSEINLWPLNLKLASKERLALPCLIEDQLNLYKVTDLDQLEPHGFGMLEPNPSQCVPIDFSLIDIALIPGLGFDLQTKHRLGFGKGHYDRFLASAPSAQTWGIGFLEQAVEKLPHSDLDIPLKQIYLF
jgi:5-formyltetrahydrofolate cyclo-ligase